MQRILEVERLHKQYAGNSEEAVNGLSFNLQEGEILAVVGESASGKSTLLRLIAGLEEPDAGSIRLQGKEIERPSQKLIPGHPDIRMAFQDYRLSPNISVRQNIAYALRTYDKTYQLKRTNQLLEACRLTGVESKLPRELSGGEQQRVAMARAIADEPVLLLLDEPFSNLDTLLKNQLKNEIAEVIRDFNTTAIFVTHDSTDALSMADRIGVMQKGKFLQLDTPREVYECPQNAYVARFFGNANVLPAEWFKQYNGIQSIHPLFWIGMLRAEDIHVCEPHETNLQGHIVRVTYAGAYSMLEVKVNHLHLLVQSRLTNPKVGDVISLKLDGSRIHFFDGE